MCVCVLGGWGGGVLSELMQLYPYTDICINAWKVLRWLMQLVACRCNNHVIRMSVGDGYIELCCFTC